MQSKKVLNHGLIRLIDSMGNDLSIVRNARVSYDAEWRSGEDKGSDKRLINYMYTDKHNTPFESVTVTFVSPLVQSTEIFTVRSEPSPVISMTFFSLPR